MSISFPVLHVAVTRISPHYQHAPMSPACPPACPIPTSPSSRPVLLDVARETFTESLSVTRPLFGGEPRAFGAARSINFTIKLGVSLHAANTVFIKDYNVSEIRYVCTNIE